MNIAISNLAWDVFENKVVAEILKNKGIKGVEIAPGKIWQSPEKLSQAAICNLCGFWDKYNITVVGTQAILYGHPELVVFKSEEVRQKTLEYINKLIQITAQIGGKIVVFGSPKNRIIGDLNKDKSRTIAYEFFHVIGEAAKRHQITFCIEPNPVEYGADFITTTKEAVEFVKKLGHPNIGINLDTSALLLNGEDCKDSLLRTLPYLKHVHLSEPYLKPLKKRDKMHKEIAGILKQIGYKGWVSIEMLLPKNKALTKIAEITSYIKEIYG